MWSQAGAPSANPPINTSCGRLLASSVPKMCVCVCVYVVPFAFAKAYHAGCGFERISTAIYVYRKCVYIETFHLLVRKIKTKILMTSMMIMLCLLSVCSFKHAPPSWTRNCCLKWNYYCTNNRMNPLFEFLWYICGLISGLCAFFLTTTGWIQRAIALSEMVSKG